MSRTSAVLLVPLASAVVALVGCGGDDGGVPAKPAPAQRAVEAHNYVASPTLGRGSAQRLFAIPGLGRFGARCKRPGEAEISYRAAAGSATQFVTTQNRGFSSNGRLNPGQQMAVAIGRHIGPRVEWQVGLLSKGRIEVATASFAAGRLSGSFGCFVTGKAEVAERQR